MKKKFIIFTLCFTLIFTSLNYKRSYADGGVISLPMLGVISALAVGSGVVLSSNDDLYDIGRMFYDYIDKHNDFTWDTVKALFASSAALQPNKLVSVESDFLDIVKSFFDYTFGSSYLSTSALKGIPVYSYDLYRDQNFLDHVVNSVGIPFDFVSSDFYVGEILFDYVSTNTDGSYNYNVQGGVNSLTLYPGYSNLRLIAFKGPYNYRLGIVCYSYSHGRNVLQSEVILSNPSLSFDFPYNGGYVWDNVDSKKEDDNSISLPIPGDLGNLVGQGSTDFWDNTDNLIDDVISVPSVDNPSIDVTVDTFPDVDVPDVDVPDVDAPGVSVPWETIKDFIIGLVVPSDVFWTDTWGSLYDNFSSSFPSVDMSGFNSLVTGEKKFPNIDVNIMGVKGRVVNGDTVNSIVDWLRPIIAGFMMLCLMFFNYRKIYKLIRNSDPFPGIANGSSDFSTGISEYKGRGGN